MASLQSFRLLTKLFAGRQHTDDAELAVSAGRLAAAAPADDVATTDLSQPARADGSASTNVAVHPTEAAQHQPDSRSPIVTLAYVAAGIVVTSGLRSLLRSRPAASPPVTTDAIQAVTDRLPQPLAHDAKVVEQHLQDGRFQRTLSLVAGTSSLMAGAEVAYEHYRGSYGQRVMWTPVVLSAALSAAGLAGAVSPTAARRVLRPVSILTLVDSAVGFGFHIRGIARKPGGWRLPVTNVVMGPPIFAPLLFGVSAYLGLIASYLRPEESSDNANSAPAAGNDSTTSEPVEIATGRFQKHLAAATVAAAFFSGFEALYSHYKNGFRYRIAQSSPLVIAPILMGAAAASIPSHRAARTLLPAASLLAVADGGVGFYYHARGVTRMPGGMKNPIYNIIYGPPIFAPLLFAASGGLGLLASLMRRER